MVESIILVGWDVNEGSLVEAVYPENAKIKKENLAFYLSTIMSVSKSPIVEIREGDIITLLFGMGDNFIKKGFNYNFISLTMNMGEIEHLEKYKSKLRLAGGQIINGETEFERKKLFREFVEDLDEKKTHEKIVFMGYPESGKSSTKKFLFEKFNSIDLLENSLAPTQGYEISFYQFLDIDFNIFDTSGQCLNRWIETNQEVLPSTDLLIFFFSVLDWQKESKEIINKIQQVHDLYVRKEDIKMMLIFCHKFDLIPIEKKGEFKQTIIKNLDLSVPIFFTSIKDNGNPELKNAIQFILDLFSNSIQNFAQFIKPFYQRLNFQPLFLLNQDFSVLADYTINKSLTSRVDVLPILSSKIQTVFKEFYENKLSYYIFYEEKLNLNIIILNVEKYNPEFSYLICYLESLENLSEIIMEFNLQTQPFRLLNKS